MGTSTVVNYIYPEGEINFSTVLLSHIFDLLTANSGIIFSSPQGLNATHDQLPLWLYACCSTKMAGLQLHLQQMTK